MPQNSSSQWTTSHLTATEKLKQMQEFAGPRQTPGLPMPTIEKFLARHHDLADAINQAYSLWECHKTESSQLLKMSESDLIATLQEGFVNFYQDVAINPFVAFAAKGPWLITSHGAVVHCNGGYGMLGFGQSPTSVVKAMSHDYVMANIMTPSFSHKRFMDRMFKEIGSNRPVGKKKPFDRLICLNSGSEAMTVASRITDIHSKIMTDPGGPHAGKNIRFLAQKGSFHGRTERPARMSDSSRKSYHVLASYRGDSTLDTIQPGNIQELRAAFERADREGFYYEAMFIEPVMGEGNPGLATTRAFYDEARRLTKAHNTMLVMDSIQAGFRATGYLSLCDYPGFEDCDAPDMESYSKAINAGQYPLSVLALTSSAASLYKKGVYGNTMTTNPRALEVACAVLDSITPELRANIREKGQEFLTKFKALAQEFPNVITNVQGTGLLLSVELAEPGYPVLAKQCVELDLRLNGIGVIHGGKNALRFTPHFAIKTDEVDLVIDAVRTTLKKGPINHE